MNQGLLKNSKYRLIFFFILIGVMTGIHWLILILKIPILQRLPYWTFPLRDTPVTLAWILLGGSALLIAATIRYTNIGTSLKIFVVFLAGIALQFSFGFSKNHGLDSLRERMINAGHAEFVIVASQQIGMLETTSNYERLVQRGAYRYIPSKPPGTLLFYMLNDRIATLINPSFDNRLENTRTFASITWPVIT